MKVKELIEVLSYYEDDIPVTLADWNAGYAQDNEQVVAEISLSDSNYINGENVRQKTLDNLNLQIDEWIKWQQEAFTLTATQFYPKVDAYDIAELDKMSGNETVNAEIVVLQEKIKERKRKRDANRETTLKKYWDEKFPENLPASVVLAVREKILKDGIVQHRGLLGDSW